MSTAAASAPAMSPLLTRLTRLTQLAAAEIDALRTSERYQRRLPARRELMAEGELIRERRALLSGWALRQRILSDGRRQILSFLLPGDLVGVDHAYADAGAGVEQRAQRRPLAGGDLLRIIEPPGHAL